VTIFVHPATAPSDWTGDVHSRLGEALPCLLRVWQIVLVTIVSVDHELCSSFSLPTLAFQLHV
jgi:hypothetical protein